LISATTPNIFWEMERPQKNENY